MFQVRLESEEKEMKVYNAHIQEVTPDKGPVTVFIEELGKKYGALFVFIIDYKFPYE